MKNYYQTLISLGCILTLTLMQPSLLSMNSKFTLPKEEQDALQQLLFQYNITQKLQQAVENNQKDEVELYISKGANVNAKNNYEESLLHLACLYGYTEIAKILLSKDTIDINAKNNYGETPLHSVCENGNTEMVELLLNNGDININAKDDLGKTPLHVACSKEDVTITQMLLSNSSIHINAKDNLGKTPLHVACLHARTETVKLLVQYNANIRVRNNKNQTPLAITRNKEIQDYLINQQKQYDEMLLEELKYRGKFADVKSYIDKGADPNARFDDGSTILYHACNNNYNNITILLLSNDEIDINAKNNEGNTPLHLVMLGVEKIEIVKLLLRNRKININVKNNSNETPLHWLCRRFSITNDTLAMLKLLLNCDNIYINEKDNNGDTPLHLACRREHTEVVKLLVNKGANIRACNNQKETPYATTPSNNPIRIYLCRASEELLDFLQNPLQLTPIKSATTGLTKPKLTTIMYNSEKGNVQFKYFLCWLSTMYLNPDFVVLGALIDKCKINKDNKTFIVNSHNFPKNSWELAFQNNLLNTLYLKKEPYAAEFDLNFIYL